MAPPQEIYTLLAHHGTAEQLTQLRAAKLGTRLHLQGCHYRITEVFLDDLKRILGKGIVEEVSV